MEARQLAQSGQRAGGPILLRPDTLGVAAADRLERLGVWVGGERTGSPKPPVEASRLQTMLDRLASSNLLVSRETPLRSCARCRSPRTPAGILYQEEPGSAFLVRFPLRGTTPRTSLLVWVDSLWKLLGATALVANPELTYLTCRYRRRESDELLLLSRSGLGRLERWLPGSTVEVLSEAPGKTFEARAYDHPLSHEVPGLGSIEPPAGLLHVTPQVTDTGTGIVTLVPSHGAGDAEVARSLGIAGWPVLDPDLTLSRQFAHKYQGLAVEAADSFIRRDLADGGYLFAELSVHRGVPHCSVCGEPLVWESGRAWCLEPGRLPPERLELFSKLLPDEPLPAVSETVPWPASLPGESSEPADPLLLECTACGRLAPAKDQSDCACGGARVPVRRSLLPVLRDTFELWAREEPIPPEDAVRLYVADRRRVPAVVHHLVALEATGAHPREVRLTVFPTLYARAGALDAGAEEPLDALRATMVGFEATPRAGAVAFQDRRALESLRLRRVWALITEILTAMAGDGLTADRVQGAGFPNDLLPEDRAFLSRFERMRGNVLRLYETGAVARVQRLLSDFFEEELRDGYLPLARPRLEVRGLRAEKLAVYATLGHVLLRWTELYAPIAPFLSEALSRRLRGGDGASVFERVLAAPLPSALDPGAERAFVLWRAVAQGLDRGRSTLGVAAGSPLGKVVIHLEEEEAAEILRRSADVVRRTARMALLEVSTPSAPWEGLRVATKPVLPELQRVFHSSAARVAHLLSELPGRRVQEGLRSGSLQVAFDGEQRAILPSMVELVEIVPEGTVPIPWEMGELFLEVPPGVRSPEAERLPPLSPDAYRLFRRVRRRLGQADRSRPVPGIEVFAQGRLSEELTRNASALAQSLGVHEVRLVDSSEGFPPDEVVDGRSGRGDRWQVWVPTVTEAARRTKNRSRHGHRVPEPPARGGGGESSEVDYLAPDVVQREMDLREWVRRLDPVLERPVLGPTKLRLAWESGFHSFDELTHASYEQLVEVPGFGPHVAAEFVRRLGGTPPVLPRWNSSPRAERDADTTEEPKPPGEAQEVPSPTRPVPGSGSGGPRDESAAGTGPPPPAETAPPSPEPTTILPSYATAPSPERPPSSERREEGPREARSEDEPARLTGPSPAGSGLSGVEPQPSPVRVGVEEIGRTAFVATADTTREEPGSIAELPSPGPSNPAELPPGEATPTAPSPPGPLVGLRLYLDPSDDRAWVAFLDATAAGLRGLCISREFPDRLRARLGARDVTVLWLSNAGREGTVRPTDLATLESTVTSTVEEQKLLAIYLESVEYLARVNSFDRLLEFLRAIDRLSRERGLRAWVPLNPLLMAAQDVERLRAEFPEAAPKGEPAAPAPR